jgi:hypothetical protein
MMMATVVRIAPMALPTDPAPPITPELLWQHIEPADQIEHLRIRAGPTTVDIFALVSARDAEEAYNRLRQAVQRMLLHHGEFKLWRII